MACLGLGGTVSSATSRLAGLVSGLTRRLPDVNWTYLAFLPLLAFLIAAWGVVFAAVTSNSG